MLMNDRSFGRGFRLHYRWEFLKFFESAEIYRLPYALIFRIPNQTGHFRLGITLKLRTSSIQRNSLKRQVRESFRMHRESLGSFDYNVVISAQKGIDFRFSQRLGQDFRLGLSQWSQDLFRKSNSSSKKPFKKPPRHSGAQPPRVS